ncbi:MAG: ABC transporter ATP-binding protein [Ruminococcaceae bacterium]|nr:ABC transporter ATP-binding protein [Oscillospiraceae bacterium]
MKLITQNIKGHTMQVVLGPVFKLIEAVLELFVPLVMANMIDVGVRERNTDALWRGGILLVVLAVAGVAAAITCQYFAAVAGGHFGRRLRSRLYAHVMKLSGKEVAEIGTGSLITRLTNDAVQVQHGLNMTIRLGTRAPYLVIGGLVMAFVVNWRLGLVFLVATPLIGVVLLLIMRRTLPGYASIQAQQDELARQGGENLAGARVIRAFSRQKSEEADFDAAAGQLTRQLVRVGRLSAALSPVTGAIVSAAIVAIVWLGGVFSFGGSSSPGEIIALVSYMNQILLAMVVAAQLIVLLTRALASGQRLNAFLAVQPAVVDGPGAAPQPGASAVAFRDVSFAYYSGAAPALSGLSFTVPAGSTVGVIGGTGSGKSTLATLLLRQQDVTAGTVLVGGVPVKDYTLAQLRGQMAVVPQRAALFTGTVGYNLRLGAPGATDTDLWKALHTAQAYDFVERLPDGLDTLIAEGGKNLSGGQKQRLSIARALVRRPAILILDDAASALDYATDAALRRALAADVDADGHKRTTLIISQRVASIRHADSILVLDDGCLAGQGTHDELLQTNPVYREICVSQGVGVATS